MKPRSEGTMWVAIPPELTAEILCRLPVKVLLQIRCVSKHWRRFIDSSYFIETHLNRSIKSRENQFLVLSGYSADIVKCVDLDFVETTVDLQIPLEHSPGIQCRDRSGPHIQINPRFRKVPAPIQVIVTHQWQKLRSLQQGEVQVWGSCNGLLLISNSFSTCLWNPSTRKHRNLPELHLVGSSLSPIYGFGYDSSSHDYKMIKILMCMNGKEEYTDHEMWVYSLLLNSWRKIFSLIMKCERQPGVLIQEALHWLVKAKSSDELNNGGEKDFILAFDLKTEEYRLFRQPECQNAQFFSRLGVFNGSSLCLVYSYMPVGFEIWVMEETWTRVTLQRGDFISYPGGFITAALRDGKDVLLHRNIAVSGGLLSDPNWQKDVSFKIFHELRDKNSDVCVVSLVSPDGVAASAQRNEAMN